MKQTIIASTFFIFFSYNLFGQQYKKWDNHDVIRFYEKKEITLDYNALDKDGNDITDRTIVYFVPTKVKDGVYEVEVSEKISSKLWKLQGTNVYAYFRYNPYLYKYDNGILEVSYSSGTFYKKP